MNVLTNGRPLGSILSGIGRYSRSLYSELEESDGVDVSYFQFGRVSREMPNPVSHLVGRQLPGLIRELASRGRNCLEAFRLSSVLRDNEFHLYHETLGMPLLRSSDVPVVQTVYDLSPLTHPQYHPAERVKIFESQFNRNLQVIDHIITISEFSRQDISETLGVDVSKVTAIPLAASKILEQKPAHAVDRFLSQKNLPRQYILSVGTREPRKNLVNLVRAFSQVDADIQLLHAGWGGWMNEELENELTRSPAKDRIRFLGHVPDEELAYLYSGALAMIYPSHYEGFGLPILEAMQCGCPVVCSNTTSMTEIASGYARMVDPADVDDIADAIESIINDSALRTELAEKGLARARDYSWQETARQTVDVFKEVLAGRNPG